MKKIDFRYMFDFSRSYLELYKHCDKKLTDRSHQVLLRNEGLDLIKGRVNNLARPKNKL